MLRTPQGHVQDKALEVLNCPVTFSLTHDLENQYVGFELAYFLKNCLIQNEIIKST